jgi:hypothetical protein
MSISRRKVIVSGAALAAASTLPSAAVAQPWAARHGLNPAQYQAVFDQMTAQGYRPLTVDGYNVAGGVYYAAIWVQEPGPGWVARHGMAPAQYQQAFNDFTSQGYRPRWISAYPGPAGVLYAAIFDKSPVASWVARHGMTPAQYQAAFDQFGAQGYHLTCVSASLDGGGTVMAGLWEKSPTGAWVARHGLDSAQYQQAFDQFSAQGYQPRQLKGYGAPGGQRFAAIFDKNGGGAWEAHHNMTGAQYQAKFDQMAANGFAPIDVTGYDMGGQAGYAAIWQKG